MNKLLSKTRKINRLIQRSTTYPVEFHQVAGMLRDVIESNVYIIDTMGKVIGYALVDDHECQRMRNTAIDNGQIPEDYNEELLQVRETLPNQRMANESCTLFSKQECEVPHKISTVIPINGGGERLGTVLLGRFDTEFTEEDLVLGEYGATVVGIEILHDKGEKVEEKLRKETAVKMATGSLSYSELKALNEIFDQLDGEEGFIVTSRVADNMGMTRSVIVNALKKLESAGVIESRSLGMKGTHLRVLNDLLLNELRKALGR